MLYDKEFLLKLDKHRNKTIYAKVIALNIEESPIETIEGRVTQGSINLDGDSAVRRSCSLTIVAANFDYSNYTWGLNTKFKLEIGVKNTIDTNYPDIIWFNQGIYVITSFNTSRSTNNFTISIQGKDKMCLLNGEVSGTIGVQTDFGTIEEENNEGVWTIRPIPIPEIIKNIVHTYGGEPYHNIIIKDLDTQGLELLEYRYDNMPLILYRIAGSATYVNPLFYDTDTPFYREENKKGRVYLHELLEEEFEMLTDDLETSEPAMFWTEDNQHVVFTKINYGDAAGYRPTELTYAGDLIANVGESITSVLDKIKNMLVEFEYFYDVEGRFIFQKKQSFASTLWHASDKEEEGIKEGLALSSTTAYTFTNGELITAFSNNPNLLNLKNDYSLWGERTSVSGATIPIHLRYALDKKPQEYTTISLSAFDTSEVEEYNQKYGTSLNSEPISITYSTTPNYDKKQNYIYVTDWREVLYQMAKDYFRYNTLTNFEVRVREANKDLYPAGVTGYEQYYTDIQVCWRQLYNPELRNKIETLESEIGDLKLELPELDKSIKALESEIIAINNSLCKVDISLDEANTLSTALVSKQQERTVEKNKKAQKEYLLEQKEEDLANYKDTIEGYYQAIELSGDPEIKYRTTIVSLTDPEVQVFERNKQKVFSFLKGHIKPIYEEEQEIEISTKDVLYSPLDDCYFDIIAIDEERVECYLYKDNRLHWNKNVFLNPSVLNYWFDFLDTEGELSQFNVKAIGARTKAVNENTIKSIYLREIPQVIFVDKHENIEEISGYKYIQVPELDKMFTISSRGKSAKERLDELLYAHGYCSESATITTIPIYYLQPNTRIHLSDNDTKLSGDFIVSKITISLAYNGTMQLTTTKAANTLFL